MRRHSGAPEYMLTPRPPCPSILSKPSTPPPVTVRPSPCRHFDALPQFACALQHRGVNSSAPTSIVDLSACDLLSSLSSMATQASRMRLHLHQRPLAKLNQVAGLATRSLPALKIQQDTISPLYRFGGVHGSGSMQKTWRNKPLFRREGGVYSTM